MRKFLFPALYLGSLVCLFYQPISIPEDSPMIDKYRPSVQLQSKQHKKEQNAAQKEIEQDSINVKKPTSVAKRIYNVQQTKTYILVDSTP